LFQDAGLSYDQYAPKGFTKSRTIPPSSRLDDC
jgi:hypothetical protein